MEIIYDYTNNKVYNVNGLLLKDNKLIPCYFLDQNILINTTEFMPIQYNTWTFIVFNYI